MNIKLGKNVKKKAFSQQQYDSTTKILRFSIMKIVDAIYLPCFYHLK